MTSVKALFITPNETCLVTSFTESKHSSLSQKKSTLVKSVYSSTPVSFERMLEKEG